MSFSAPVTLGILDGFPQSVSLAKTAKQIASFASAEIPRFFTLLILTSFPKYFLRDFIRNLFLAPPPLTNNSSIIVSD